jgi:hypothetical protein
MRSWARRFTKSWYSFRISSWCSHLRYPRSGQRAEHGLLHSPVTAATDYRCGPYQGNPNVCVRVVQTNNVATDDRGYIYIVDRANTGLHILQIVGDTKMIIEGE